MVISKHKEGNARNFLETPPANLTTYPKVFNSSVQDEGRNFDLSRRSAEGGVAQPRMKNPQPLC